MVSYLVHYDIFLQNAADIITKYGKSLLRNASAFLLQNVTVLLRNLTVLLQNVTVITKRNDFVTKCDVYYKMRQCNVRVIQ